VVAFAEAKFTGGQLSDLRSRGLSRGPEIEAIRSSLDS
jgi:hypothetical protein